MLIICIACSDTNPKCTSCENDGKCNNCEAPLYRLNSTTNTCVICDEGFYADGEECLSKD